MFMLRSLCLCFELYVYTFISMFVLRSLCLCFDLYAAKLAQSISLEFGYDAFVRDSRVRILLGSAAAPRRS